MSVIKLIPGTNKWNAYKILLSFRSYNKAIIMRNKKFPSLPVFRMGTNLSNFKYVIAQRNAQSNTNFK